jgi:fatty acid desaturase
MKNTPVSITEETQYPLFAKVTLSDAAQWHKQRRQDMIHQYGSAIRSLETHSSSQTLAFPLLIVANFTLLAFSILSGLVLSLPQVVALAIFPGSILSLWQLQILHDCLHGSLWNKSTSRFFFNKISKQKLQEFTLFWGSLPCVFGYYLYLKFGHMSHHSNVGDPEKSSLQRIFESNQVDFEDGDVLFVAHRMKLLGNIGPTFHWGNKQQQKITVSLSHSGFHLWRETHMIRNASMFWISFLLERFLLVLNDGVVSITGRNYFFPNKPVLFHAACARYARVATTIRLLLWTFAGWKSLLFLYLSETLWSLPPHPACAMFVTNHGSDTSQGTCHPSSSTYAGRWYSTITLGTNYHCEHHDFPTIPLHQLGKLHQIAPEFYPHASNPNPQNIFAIMRRAFSKPDWYGCMKVGVGGIGT